jgi:prepilin-type N-terminal cleavage/methylation domain-containing protein
MKDQSANRAFTLIELLVVIALLALLLALLVPSLAKCKEQTRRVVCASNQRQIVLGIVLYAGDHDGYLANYTMAVGPNAHNVDKRYVEMMENQYSVNQKFFFCPSTTRENIRWRLNYNKNSPSLYALGYFLLVPRYSTGYDSQIPPPVTKGELRVIDSTKYWGPQKMTDPLAQMNPVSTDEVATVAGSPPDADICKDYSLINSLSCHLWRKRLELSNQAFLDGKVIQKKPDALKAHYGYKNPTQDYVYLYW